VNLGQFVDMMRGEAPSESPVAVELVLKDGVPPPLLERFAKLQRLGLLNGDVLLSMIAQAPIDPLGVVTHLMAAEPTGWVFSAIDCSIVRVLARNTEQQVSAAMRIDLLDDTVETLVVNKARQLTPFQRFETLSECTQREPGPWILSRVKQLADEAIVAALREAN
jgi:hypothetical protein